MRKVATFIAFGAAGVSVLNHQVQNRLANDKVDAARLAQVRLRQFIVTGPFPTDGFADDKVSLFEALRGRCGVVMAVRRPG